MEPISLFISTFIELVDRLTNLEKTKFQDKQTLFSEIVKPLFDELEPVASNYIGIFQKSRKSITMDSLNKLREAISLFEKEREVMLMARIKIRQMAFQIQEYIKDEEVVMFADAILTFFGAVIDINDKTSTRTSRFLRHLQEIELEAEITEEDKIRVARYIEENLTALEHSWGLIVKSYENLKIHSVSSPKYIRESSIKKTKS